MSTLDDVNLPEHLPAIVVIAYNRPYLLKQVLDSLEIQTVKPPKIMAFIDAPKKPEDLPDILECKKLIEAFKACPVEIHMGEFNRGCAKNITWGINTTFEKFETLVLAEDDVVFSPRHYEYTCKLLEKYKKEKVFSVFTHYGRNEYDKNILRRSPSDFFVYPTFHPWGCGLWRDKWKTVQPAMESRKNPYGTMYNLPKTIRNLHVVPQLTSYFNYKCNLWSQNIYLLAQYYDFIFIACKLSTIKNIGYGDPKSTYTVFSEGDINDNYVEILPSTTLPETLELPSEYLKPASTIHFNAVAFLCDVKHRYSFLYKVTSLKWVKFVWQKFYKNLAPR